MTRKKVFVKSFAIFINPLYVSVSSELFHFSEEIVNIIADYCFSLNKYLQLVYEKLTQMTLPHESDRTKNE